MSEAFYTTEERDVNGTRWVAIRARDAEWSWLTPEEALQIARTWIDKYVAKATS